MFAIRWLLLVLLLGGVLRFYDLNTNPPELFSDELDLYVSARSIATTGHDIDGTLHPLLFCWFTRNPPMYALAGYVSTLIIGNSPFGWRFPAAFFGLIAIALLYAIVLELTTRQSIALTAAFFQAIMPLFVHFSRVGWEPASELPFLLGGLFILLRAFRAAQREGEIRFWNVALGGLLLGMTTYTYAGAWFYAAMLGGSLIALYVPRLGSFKDRAKVLGAIVIWAVVAAPALWMLFMDPYTSSRMYAMGTFRNGFTFDALHAFATNYVGHFSWPYLVSTGDGPDTRMQRELGGFGALYWWMLPLCMGGLMHAGRFIRDRQLLVWSIIWLAVYPLGGALTHEAALPNAGRTLAGAPIFCILAALGFFALLDLSRFWMSPKSARLYTWGVCGFLMLNAGISVLWFSSFYFVAYPKITAPAWQSGTRAMFAVIRKHAPGYKRVCFEKFWIPSLRAYVAYYMSDVSLRAIENIADPECFQPGTLLVTMGELGIARSGFMPVENIRSIDGSTYAVIEKR